MTQQSAAGSAGISEWLLGSVRQNPEGLLLLAAGAVLLMRKSSSPAPTHRTATSHFQRSGDFRDTTVEMDEAAFEPGFAQQAKETTSSLASSASEYAGAAGRRVGAQSERIVRSAQSTLQSSMNRILQEQPLLVAVAGLAAGAAIAAAFPATGVEKQTLGPLGDQLSEAASRVGEQLKDATAKAGETLKNAAEERGLNTDGLKEVVTEAAGTFSDTMSGKKNQGSPQSGFEAPPLTEAGPR